MPLYTSQELDITHRRNEGALVLRRKRTIDPIEQSGQRYPNALPALADNHADRRPGQRYESRGYRAGIGPKTVDEAQGAAAAAKDEDTRLVT